MPAHYHFAAIVGALAGVVATLLGLAGPVAAQTPCIYRPSPGGFAFTGLNPAIEGRRALEHFAKGQIVEIDPLAMKDANDARRFVVQLQREVGTRVSIYLVGGHCNIENKDCAGLGDVAVGSTGSWNWDRDERRIHAVTDARVMKRLADGIRGGFALGANYIRIDNLHNPAGSDPKSWRTAEQLAAIYRMAFGIEDEMRTSGAIPPDRVTGFVAHNSFIVWEEMLSRGMLRRAPVFMTSERTAQLAQRPGWSADKELREGRLWPKDIAEVVAAGKIAQRLKIPYSVVEFRRAHDLGGPRGNTYEMPEAYVGAMARMAGVTEVIVMASESQYVGRGQVLAGAGITELAARPDTSACKGR